jgi:hypothetical protein
VARRGHDGGEDYAAELREESRAERVAREALVAELTTRVRDLKAQDLAAKRAKNWDARPGLGEQIAEGMAALNAAKEARHG